MDFLLRGGRLTKVAGEVASYAASVGRSAHSALAGAAAIILGVGFGGAALTALTAVQALAACSVVGGVTYCTGATSGSGNNARVSTSNNIVLGTDASLNFTGSSASPAIDMTATGSAYIEPQTLTQSGTGEIRAEGNAIHHKATNGYGGVTIDVKGTVVSTASEAIFVEKGRYGSAVVISARDVTGKWDGIKVKVSSRDSKNHNGALWTSITSTGTVTATNNGIYVRSSNGDANTAGITVTANNASGTGSGGKGIYIQSANNAGPTTNKSTRYIGSVSVTVTGTVTGGSGAQGSAIRVKSSSVNKYVKIDVASGATVGTGGEGHALFLAEGRLKATVNSGATVHGNVRTFSGLGGRDEITFKPNSTGTLTTVSGIDVMTIESRATVKVGGSGTSVNKLTLESGGTLDIAHGNVIGSFTVGGGNFTGGGTITLGADFSGSTPNADKLYFNGDVSGTTTLNINRSGSGATGEFLVVHVGALDSSNNFTVNSNSFVAGSGYSLRYDSSSKKFYAEVQAATNSCVETSTGSGVFQCSGAITATQTLSASANTSLSVSLAQNAGVAATSGNAFDLSSSAGISFEQSGSGTISARDGGIIAQNAQSGSIAIRTRGKVTAAGGRDQDDKAAAIAATNTGTQTGDITITAADVQSWRGPAIIAVNNGTGAVRIHVAGSATAIGQQDYPLSVQSGAAIYAKTGAAATDLSISVVRKAGAPADSPSVTVLPRSGEAAGLDEAVHAKHYGSGSLTISAEGALRGATDGVQVSGSSSGSIGINVPGGIVARSAGIRITQSPTQGRVLTGALTISAGDLIGAGNGKFLRSNNNGAMLLQTSGAIDVTISGHVDRASGYQASEKKYGILTRSAAGKAVKITLESGAEIDGANGQAIVDTEGNAAVTVNTGAWLEGAVKLGSGADGVTVSGGSIRGSVDLGSGDDRLNISGGGNVEGAVDGGAGDDDITVSGTGGTLSGTPTNFKDLTIESGATLKLAGAATFSGEIDLSGTLDLSGDGAIGSFSTSGNFIGGGEVILDANFADGTADTLEIGGNATGVTTIGIAISVFGSNSAVEIVEVAGQVSGSAFALSEMAKLEYTLSNAGGTFTLALRPERNCALSSGVYICNGPFIAPQSMSSGTTPLTVVMASGATVIIPSTAATPGHGFDLDTTGNNNHITFTQSGAAGVINGSGTGVAANSSGGDVTISTEGTVIGRGGHGISAESGKHRGSVTVRAAGRVAGSGTEGSGIFAKLGHSSGGSQVAIAAADVEGAKHGIHVELGNRGHTDVMVSGSVSGGTSGIGIYIESSRSGYTHSITLESGARVSGGSGGITILRGMPVLSATNATISDGITLNSNADQGSQINLIDTEVSGDLVTGSGTDTVSFQGGSISGNVELGLGNDTLTISDATVTGTVNLGDGEDTVTVNGVKISGNLDLGGHGDRLTFGPGFSSMDEVKGTDRASEPNQTAHVVRIESGAVVHIRDVSTFDRNAVIAIKPGAMAILDKPGLRKALGLDVEGTLNTADGTYGDNSNNSNYVFNMIFSIPGHRGDRPNRMTGTWIFDAHFNGGYADNLHWNASHSGWPGPLTLEPVIPLGAGKLGGYVPVAPDGFTTYAVALPEAFNHHTHPELSGRRAVRQIMANGACTSAGSGVFTCADLIYETQELSASGTELDVTLNKVGVVHALAETQSGLALLQTGAGGITLTQSAAGSRIAAAGHAIYAKNAGPGSVSIVVTGSVVGGMTGRVEDADGIVAVEGVGGDGINISATSVTGFRHGIAATAVGSGGASIRTTSSVTGMFGTAAMIDGGIGPVDASIGGSVAGARGGIRASATEAGRVSVMVSGSVASRLGTGVDISAGRGGATARIGGSVSAGMTGIRAVSAAGPLSIDAVGAVLATGNAAGAGIDAAVVSGAGALTITAATVTGSSTGISAVANRGAVTVNAAVVTGGEAGIRAIGTAGAVTVNAATVTGGEVGIRAIGTAGAVSIEASGAVSATGNTAGVGVDALASSVGDISVTAAAVTGSAIGINVVNSGAGDVGVVATGRVTGTSMTGISATASAGAVTVNAATVTGSAVGIRAMSSGAGDVGIDAGGAVLATGTAGVGIDALASSGDIAIAAATVTGSAAGIRAVSSGAGDVSIDASGAVSATGTVAGVGIDALAPSGDIAIAAAAVVGSAVGIRAVSSGAGAVSVSATGAVTGTATAGVRAIGGTATGAMTINVAAVTGKTGIEARQGSANALNVTANGAVTGTGTDGAGINALASSGGALSVNATRVTGSAAGIRAVSNGTGAVLIGAAGTVSATGATSSVGIYAKTTGAILIDAATARGTHIGISASGLGTAAVSINATGTVTGRTGIQATAPSNNAITVTAADVSSSNAGIVARTRGAISIHTTGSVQSSADNGIYADQQGTGTTQVTVSGAVSSNSTNANHAAIRAKAANANQNQTVTITLESGAAVSAAKAIMVTDFGTATVTVNSGATVSGAIETAGGDDTLAVEGGSVSSDIDLGLGDDRLRVTNGTASGSIDLGTGADELRVTSGTVSGTLTGGIGLDTLRVTSGSVEGALAGWENVTVESGGSVKVLGSATVTDLTVAGTLNLNDGAIGDFTVSGAFTGGGTVILDANGATADKLVIGNVSGGTTTIDVDVFDTGSAAEDDEIEIVEVTGNGTVSASLSALASIGYTLKETSPGDKVTLIVKPNGSCTLSSGVYQCVGPIRTSQALMGTGTQLLSVVVGTNAVVTIPSTVPAPGHGIELDTSTGLGRDISFTQSGADRFISGSATGIHAEIGRYGGLNVSITTEGTVTGRAGHGIYARTRTHNSSITVRASGPVIGSGSSSAGIHAELYHTSGGDLVQITAVDVRGGKHGIHSKFTARGATDITVSGSVSGGSSGHGIYVESGAGWDEFTHTIALESGASVSGGIRVKAGQAVLRATNATISGGVEVGTDTNNSNDARNDQITLVDTDVSGGLKTYFEADAVSIRGGSISGNVDLGAGNDTLTISDATVTGTVNLGDGEDTVTVNGVKISGNLDLGGHGDRLTFGPGFSSMTEIRGADKGTLANEAAHRIQIESGAVVHIRDVRSVNRNAVIEIKSGAMAILDEASWRQNIGGIDVEGTLNTADGTMGNRNNRGNYVYNLIFRLPSESRLTGVWIFDANFNHGDADGLSWLATAGQWPGPLTLEPAIPLGAGKLGGMVEIGSNNTTYVVGAPEAFSHQPSPFTFNAVRAVTQIMANGACASEGSGVFTCSNLIYETAANLRAWNEALDVTLNKVGVVHALAGTQSGLALWQTGDGGITLTQSATGGRIAAAGHAIHASNEGAGSVSIVVTGAVIGGMTGRVENADGIVALDGAAGDGVYVSAASVTGLRHGIVATAGRGRGATVKTSGDVTGRHGTAVLIDGGSGDAMVEIDGAVTGYARGIHARADGAVSISVTGAISLASTRKERAYVTVLNSESSSEARVSLRSGASINGSGTVFRNDAGSARFTVESGASVRSSGGVDLGAGIDTLEVAGGGRLALGGAVSGLDNLIVRPGGTFDLGAGAASGRQLDVLRNFTGGGNLVVNADFSAGTAHRLQIGGDVTGVTTVDVFAIGYTSASDSGIDVISGDQAGSGKFVLSAASNIEYELEFDQGTGTITPRPDGSCTEGSISVYTCSGPIRTSQILIGTHSNTLTVTMESTAVVRIPPTDPTRGHGFELRTSFNRGTGISLTQSGADRFISGSATGIHAEVADRVSFGNSGQAITIVTEGSVTGRAGQGIFAKSEATDINYVTVRASGTVVGSGANSAGIHAELGDKGGQLVQIEAADVRGKKHGIHVKLLASGHSSVVVSGSVSGESSGYGVYVESDLSDFTHTLTLESGAHVSGPSGGIRIRRGRAILRATNATVSGHVSLGRDDISDSGGNNEVTLTDTSVLGRLSAHTAADVVSIRGGSVTSGINLGSGTDMLTLNGATVTGGVELGTGDDTLTLSGGTVTGNVNFDAGDDSLTLRGATVTGNVSLGTGADTAVFHGGTVTGDISLGAGGDRMTLNATRVTGRITLGSGSDLLTVGGGRIANVHGGDGNDDVNVSGSGKIDGLTGFRHIDIASGATLGLAGSATFAGTINLNGTLDLSGDDAFSKISAAGMNNSSGATVVLDVDFAANKADSLGDFIPQGRLTVNVNVIEEDVGKEVAILKASSSAVQPDVVIGGDNASRFSLRTDGFLTYLTQDKGVYSERCTETAAGSGVFNCLGAILQAQTLSVSGNTSMTVALGRDASITATTGTALRLSSQSGISLTQSGTGEIRSAAGIHAVNSGGSVSISVVGRVTATSTADGGKAIYAANRGTTTGDLTIAASAVSGAGIGIEALNEGSGTINVTVSGSAAGSDAAIKTRSRAQQAVTIALSSGAAVEGGMIDEAGNAAVTVGAGASMSGSVDLGAGDDRVNVTGRIVSGTLAAGAGNDTLTVHSGGSIGGASAAASASGWESIAVERGGEAALSMAAGSVDVTQVTLAGRLSVADDAHTTLDISGNFVGGGVLVIDVNFADGSGDKLDVTGVITGITEIQVKRSGRASRDGFAFAVAGAASPDAFVVRGASYVLDYDSATRTHLITSTIFVPCAETSSGSGVFICSGDDEGRGADTQALSASGNAALSVTLNSETGVDAVGSAFVLTQTGGPGGIAFTQSARGEAIKGTESGIIASNTGGGAIAIDVNGAVTGVGGDGIRATSDASGSGVTITAASVAGGATGIRVDASGAGRVSLSASGAVAGTAGDGIFVEHGGSGATRIAVSGAVTGASGANAAAIRTDVSAGSDVTILLGRGADVGDGAANAILGSAGDTDVTVNAGAEIAGRISLGGGADALTFAGGAFSAVTEMDGGEGSGDTLTFSAGSGGLHATVVSEGLKGWERIVVGRGATVSGNIKLADDSGNLILDGATLGSSTLIDGGGGAANMITLRNMSGPVNRANLPGWETIDVGNGSTISLGSSVTVDTMRVSAGGTLDGGNDSDTDDAFTISGNFEGGGAISFNVNFDPNNIAMDTLTINGDVTGTTTLSIGKIAETGSIDFNDRLLTITNVVRVTGSVSANAFVAGGDVIFGAVGYRTKFNQGAPGAASTFDLERYWTNECEAVVGVPGAFTCSGVNQIGDGQSLSASGATALTVTLSAETPVDTNATAFALTQTGGRGGIAFTQARGGMQIRGVESGIAAANTGGGAISIRVNGTVIGANGDGISATNDASGAGIAIFAARASGRTAGIKVNDAGAGSVSISALGSVTATAGDGIVVERGGRGATSIAVSGDVTGGSVAGKAAIRTAGAGGTAAILLASGASVRAAGNGSAILDGGAAATVTVQTGAAIQGGVSLGAGADELVLAGGDFSGITAIDGGEGADTLRVTAGSGTLAPLSDAAGTRNVERIVVSGSAMLLGDIRIGAETAELVFADGADIGGAGRLIGVDDARLALRGVNGRLDVSRLSNWKTLEIGAGSRVALGAAVIERTDADGLAVTGTMTLGDEQPGDELTVQGDFSGGGQLEIDTNFANRSSDRLIVGGDVSGATGIVVNDRTPQGAVLPGGDIEVVTVSGEVDASAFRLLGDGVPFGAFSYGLLAEDGAFLLRPGDKVSDTGAALRSAPAAIAVGFAKASALSARTAARAPAAAVGSGIGSAQTHSERGAALAGQGAAELAEAVARPMWARFYSDKREFGADATGGAAEIDSNGMQFGMDLFSAESQSGKWVAGVTAQYGSVTAESVGVGGVGTLEASGYGVGATVSWFGYSGLYADAQAQFGTVDSDYSSNTMGVIKSGVSAGTALAAIEAGLRMAMGERSTLVPQGQISMSSVDREGFVSGDLDVRPAITTAIEGRLGVAAEYALSRGGIRVSGSLHRTLSEADGLVVDGKTIDQGLPDGWIEFGIGGSLDVSDDAVIFFDGSWSAGSGRDDASGASLSGGFKLNW